MEILLAIGLVVFIIYASFSIAQTIELRRTSMALRHMIARTEESLQPPLAAARGILENVKKSTDNVFILTEQVREMVEAVRRVEQSVTSLYEYYLDGMGESARANIAGLKAGVQAGVSTLLRDLSDKKEGSS